MTRERTPFCITRESRTRTIVRCAFLLLICALTIVPAACVLRGPDEGYDPDWEPDHSEEEATGETDRPGGDHGNEYGSRLRPMEIVADTGTMEKSTGSWEMVGKIPSEFTVYRRNGKPALIVEQMGDHTRRYFFNDGALFYYNETGVSGGFELTVEFDEIGDVIGTRWLLDGEELHVDRDDIAEIVEHAVELKLLAEQDNQAAAE